MSLVALINIFFHQRLVPVNKRLKSHHLLSTAVGQAHETSGPCAWEDITQKPLLASQSDVDSLSSSDPTEDIESQHCTESRSSGENRIKGLRFDARLISDATIGLSDGLTVPFALTAGLSAIGNTDVVIYGGLAELTAGAISMGLGGYLGAKSEVASYHAQREKTKELLSADPKLILQDVVEIFKPYSIPRQTINDLTQHLFNSPCLVDFFMQFKYCAEKPSASRALMSATTIALGYFIGGMLPLLPYFFVSQARDGLFFSIGLMIIALFTFGYVKTGVIEGWKSEKNIRSCCYGGMQMVVVGSAAAAAAMGLVKLFESGDKSHGSGSVVNL
ncbi:Protein CCC1 [Golovinomyces cichoracearum]|uniref:Protein CCC1 n=1 Tax=Golovinomyces cichoracearum TaxID=62708 RepID=A0A420HLR6_9PEZI|nr:Protein CCC1 [Golovinomyces cichoracearum]